MTNAERIIEALTRKGECLAAAESCTGGGTARLLTGVPGASAVFTGGMTAYDPRIKVEVLGVPASTIKEHGVVSHETAMAMAECISALMGSTWGLSTTGYAGPGGGDEKYPVGTVCFGIFSKRYGIKRAWHAQFHGTRNEVMSEASEHLLAEFIEIMESCSTN